MDIKGSDTFSFQMKNKSIYWEMYGEVGNWTMEIEHHNPIL